MNDRGTSETIVTAEHFQEKREPVFRPKMQPGKKTGAHSASIELNAARRSDSRRLCRKAAT
jgi:hypothetical protein